VSNQGFIDIYLSNKSPNIMKNYILLVFLLLATTLPAQTYRNLCSPGNILYQAGTQFKQVQVDTVQPLGNDDTLFITFPTIRDIGTSCLDTAGGSVLGRNIVSLHDGTYLFFNFNRDTIRILTQAALNDTWKMFSYGGQDYIEATVSAIEKDTFATVIDSVKVITLQAKDSAGQNIPGTFNGKEIRLSKNYGLSGIYDLYMFPQDTLLYTLAGRTIPMFGVQELTSDEIYDYAVGDEFQYTGSSSVNQANEPVYTWKELWTIEGKDITGLPDSISYSIRKCKLLKTTQDLFTPDKFNYTETLLTISYKLSQMQTECVYASFPDEFCPTYFESGAMASAYYLQSGDYNGRITKGDRTRYDKNNDCWEYWGYPGSEFTEYTAGLGITHKYRGSNEYGDQNYEQKLEYYKKGTETYGTPVVTNCEEMVPYLSIAEDTIILSNIQGDCKTLAVTANYTWVLNWSYLSGTWLSIDPTGGTGNGEITFCTLENNEDAAQRICWCTIQVPPALEIPFVVIQKGKPSAVEGSAAVSLKIFPNPTTGMMRINSAENITRVEIVGPSGITIKTIDCNSCEVTADLSGNPPGLYILRITSESGTVSRKVNLVK
jgi:hypothetical protein